MLVAAARLLAEDELGLLLQRLLDLQADRRARHDSEFGRMLAFVRAAMPAPGAAPTTSEYRTYREAAVARGEQVPSVAELVAFFGSWREAREAVALSEVTTARGIERRFSQRRLGKVWRYHDQTLRETLARCVEAVGRPPTVAEFEWWRRRELELARARGDDALHLPSAGPYRKRFGNWEEALRRLGYGTAVRARRLDPATR